MERIGNTGALIGWVLVSTVTTLEASSIECHDWQNRWNNLARAQNYAAMREHIGQTTIESQCRNKVKDQMRDELQSFLLEELSSRKMGSAANNSIILELEQLDLHSWQTAQAIGRHYHYQRDLKRAHEFYLIAHEIAQDPFLRPRPDEAQAQAIADLYDEVSLVLHGTDEDFVKSFKPPVVTRSGNSLSLYGFGTRGVVRKKRQLPISFITASTELNEAGETVFKRLSKDLIEEGSPDILIIGHADERGKASYNQKLSERRAEAIKKLLKSQGYSGEIRTDGRGESEAFPFEDRSIYTQEELYAADRRVELKRVQ